MIAADTAAFGQIVDRGVDAAVAKHGGGWALVGLKPTIVSLAVAVSAPEVTFARAKDYVFKPVKAEVKKGEDVHDCQQRCEFHLKSPV